jgi:choline dehydrogenase-like flavoprotein
MSDIHQYDVVVVGGGPAGSTTAALLAKRGRDVLVLERERFPRYHIGESLRIMRNPPLCAFSGLYRSDLRNRTTRRAK